MFALVAVLALSALAAASASAAPWKAEFKLPGTAKTMKFTLTGGTAGFSEREGTSFSCSSSHGEGEITGAKTATATLTFKGCANIDWKCTSEGAKAEEIKIGSMPVELVYTSREHNEAALVFNYKGGIFGQWSCGSFSDGIERSIIVPITPVNTKTASYSLKFAASEGKQTPRVYEGEEGEKVTVFPELKLLGWRYFEGALTSSMTLTGAEAFEIVA